MPLFGQEKSAASLKVPEVVAVDMASTGYKLLRVKKTKDGPVITAADFIPTSQLTQETAEGSLRVKLPKAWGSYYVALAVPGEKAVIRYVSLPGVVDRSPEVATQLKEHMGLEDGYRLQYVVTSTAPKRTETRLLAAALPEEDAATLLAMVATGNPATLSIEVASMAALNAFFTYGSMAEHAEDAVGFIEAGSAVTLLALFNKGALVLVRKFNIGGETLAARVQEQMGVEREVAEGIIAEGAFDISQPVQDVMDPFLRQISISKDFVERREGCHISALYVSGGMSLSRYWIECVQRSVGIEVLPWNPFSNAPVADGAVPESLAGQETRFAAAVGLGLGVFEDL